MNNHTNAERAGRVSARTLMLTILFSALFLVALTVLAVGAAGDGNSVSSGDTVTSSSDAANGGNQTDNQENQAAEGVQTDTEEVTPSDYDTSSPKIIFKTSKASGSEFSFYIYMDEVCVDLGDGNPVVLETSNGMVTCTLKGSTVKFYGGKYVGALADVTDIECTGEQLTSIDVSKCKETLEELIVSDNSLTSLNLSGYKRLMAVSCDNNKLTSLDVTNSPYLEFILLEGNSSLSSSKIKLWSSSPITIQTEVNVNDIIELGAYNYMVNDDSGCEYNWYDASTKKEVEVSSDGACTFEFDETLKGKSLYCEITQPTLKISVKTTTVKVVAEKLQQEGGNDFVSKTTPSDDLIVKDGDGNQLDAADFKIVISTLAYNEKDPIIAAVKKLNTSFDETKSNYSLYDISLQSLDGEELTISKGSVRVTLTYPTDKFESGKKYSDYSYTVYHYNSKGVAEKVNNISCGVDGISFTTSSFSPYMLTWTAKSSGGSSTDSPSTGENIVMTAAAIYAVLFSLTMIGITLIKIKMSRGRREEA